MKRAALLLVVLLAAGPTLGGINYTAASSEYHQGAASATAADVPFSVSLQYAVADEGGGTKVAISFTDSADAEHRYMGWFSNRSGNWLSQEGGIGQSGSSNIYLAGVWHQVVYLEEATNRRTLWAEGVSSAANTASNAVVGVDSTAFGTEFDGTPRSFFNGALANVALWTAYELTPDQIGALAAGAWPPYVQPASLSSFWPCFGDNVANEVRDVVGRVNLDNVNGTPTKVGHQNRGPWPGMQQ